MWDDPAYRRGLGEPPRAEPMRSPSTVVPRLAALCAVLIAVLAVLAPAPAQALSPGGIIARFNAERKHNGIPARIRLSTSYANACAAHDRYMAKNRTLTHFEIPGRPGYTAAGARIATNAVLAFNSPFSKGNPWETGPYHLLQVLDPRLELAGAAEAGGYQCMSTFPGYRTRSARRDVLYGWPGPGRTDAPYFEQADENPHVPGTLVGLHNRQTTGPYVTVYWNGPRGAGHPALDVLRSGSITGPSGRVKTRIVSTANDHSGLTFRGTGFIIAVKPLKPGTTYSVRARFATAAGVSPARAFTSGWSFRTAKAPAPTTLLRIKGPHRHGNSARFDFKASAALNNRFGTCTVRYGLPHFTGSSFRCLLGPNAHIDVSRPPSGTITLTVTIPAFRSGGVSYPRTTVSATGKG